MSSSLGPSERLEKIPSRRSRGIALVSTGSTDAQRTQKHGLLSGDIKMLIELRGIHKEISQSSQHFVIWNMSDLPASSVTSDSKHVLSLKQITGLAQHSE